MATQSCGCATQPCGCCEGIQRLTPESTANRPGLAALRYRVGTHGSFLQSMKAALGPLSGLTTRDPGDPAIALLDGWATVGDVLTFYQERIANEGYLRTATERRSVLELARLVGYTLRPGVASTVYLAYTLEEKQAEPVTIPAGARSQSVPGPEELPQPFETSEPLEARAEWNNLQVRLTRPMNITFDNALTIETIYIAGTAAKLATGDVLLLRFGDGGEPSVVRTVQAADQQFELARTLVTLQPVPPVILDSITAFRSYIADLTGMGLEPQTGNAKAFLTQLYLGASSVLPQAIQALLPDLDTGAAGAAADRLQTLLKELETAMGKGPGGNGATANVTRPSVFVQSLLKPAAPQARSALRLTRSLATTFAPQADVHAQLLVSFVPRLKDTFYRAWSSASVNSTPRALKELLVFRVAAPLFGANAPRQFTTYGDDEKDSQGIMHGRGEPKPPAEWEEWPLDGEQSRVLHLDKAYEAIQASSFVLVQSGMKDNATRLVRQVRTSEVTQRSAYGISGKTTRLELFEDTFDLSQKMPLLRAMTVYAQAERLDLAEEPMLPAVVGGSEIPLARLYDGLTSGRWIIFSGERTDIPEVSGVPGTELLMISGLRQDYDPALPGDKTHTTLVLATSPAYTYKRATLKIYGNVVKASHGETRNETLGSGDGSQPFQSFTLKQPPVTFVAAPTPAGAETTLKVFVNDVQWRETDTFADLGAKDRRYLTRTDDDAKTAVVFGNGTEGARPPTGVENIKAVYRSGIGAPGNVRAGQVSLLLTKPLGVQEVLNPLRASGGADKESRDQARENAPLGVMSLDRLVSVQDYADFTRTFAGIGKAAAQRLSDGARLVVHVTIAGAGDIPIDPASDLYRNLVDALRQLGDADLPVRVQARELVILVLSARVRLTPDYQWEPVATAIRARLLEEYGFEKRPLGRPALLCEVVSLIQAVPGVAYVDVEAFGGIPEKVAEPDGTRRLLELDEMADRVSAIAGAAPRVEVNLADVEHGALRPAQLALFTAAVPDTLILNPIP